MDWSNAQWDGGNIWSQNSAEQNAAGQAPWDHSNQSNGGTFFNPTAPAFQPPGQNASGYGSYGLAEIQRAQLERAEIQRANQRTQNTRAHAAARERASTAETAAWEQQEHVKYDQVQQQQQGMQQQDQQGGHQAPNNHGSRRTRRHQRQRQESHHQQQPAQQQQQLIQQEHFDQQQGLFGQQHFIQQHQQFLQQQVPQGSFHPTAPNFNNFNNKLPVRPGFNTPLQETTGLPTPPRTNSPSKQLNSRPRLTATHLPRSPPPIPTTPGEVKPDRDAIVPPSPGSGGIPEPSPAYTTRSSFLPRTLPTPQPLLIIIDLNGTLLYRPNSHRNPRHFVLRPGAQRFLTFCLTHHKVMIWSSARPGNVAAMLDKLMTKAQLTKLVAIWGRDHFGLTPEDYRRRVQCYKRLTKVWSDPLVKSSYPHGYNDHGILVTKEEREDMEAMGQKWTPGCWSQGNTVLIDDSREKARSEPFNAIEIPEFKGEMGETVLPRVREYLERLAKQADVSTFMRVEPFKVADGE